MYPPPPSMWLPLLLLHEVILPVLPVAKPCIFHTIMVFFSGKKKTQKRCITYCMMSQPGKQAATSTAVQSTPRTCITYFVPVICYPLHSGTAAHTAMHTAMRAYCYTALLWGWPMYYSYNDSSASTRRPSVLWRVVALRALRFRLRGGWLTVVTPPAHR